MSLCRRCFNAACDAGFDKYGVSQDFIPEQDCSFWAHKLYNDLVNDRMGKE